MEEIKVPDINEIYKMLNWESSPEVQSEGKDWHEKLRTYRY